MFKLTRFNSTPIVYFLIVGLVHSSHPIKISKYIFFFCHLIKFKKHKLWFFYIVQLSKILHNFRKFQVQTFLFGLFLFQVIKFKHLTKYCSYVSKNLSFKFYRVRRIKWTNLIILVFFLHRILNDHSLIECVRIEKALLNFTRNNESKTKYTSKNVTR